MSAITRQRLSVCLLVAVSVVSLTGFGCRRNQGPSDQFSGELVVWGLWQDSAQMEPVLKAFSDSTGVKVSYKKIAAVSTYEKDLLEALAEGRGPDVFAIHHTWVDSLRRIMSPAPAKTADERIVRNEFVDIVADDLVRDGLVYALPTSVDTLALYYNKDLYNSAGVARPPMTWTEFQQTVERVSRVNRLGSVELSAAALGTAANVNRAPDVLQLLWLQSGLSIYDAKTGQTDINNDIGKRALAFYTDFANKAKKVYTWNLQQDYSIDAFTQGTTASMLSYSYQIPVIRAKNPRLNFGVAPMPQIADNMGTKRVDFAAYWPFAVSSSSKAPSTAWQLIRFITSKDAADSINGTQKVPPALRASVVELERDPELGVFAEQALTAKGWPQADSVAIDSIINSMIDDVVSGAATVDEAIQRGNDQIAKVQEEISLKATDVPAK